jgi:outer membrane lipoprotein SlyB
MSVWSIGSLDEEEQKKQMGAMPKGFGGPASVEVQDGMGTQIMKQAGGAMASKVGSVAGAAIGNAILPGIGGFIGSSLGSAAGGALAGGGGGAPTAQAPKFDGGDLVNKQADTSVTIPTQQVAQGPLSLNQEATQRAFDEEEYMRKFGGNSYAVQ